MKTKNLITGVALSAGLAFGVTAQAKEHEEQTISSTDVPAAVQKAAETHAKGGTIVRWEKEGANLSARQPVFAFVFAVNFENRGCDR